MHNISYNGGNRDWQKRTNRNKKHTCHAAITISLWNWYLWPGWCSPGCFSHEIIQGLLWIWKQETLTLREFISQTKEIHNSYIVFSYFEMLDHIKLYFLRHIGLWERGYHIYIYLDSNKPVVVNGYKHQDMNNHWKLSHREHMIRYRN